MSIDDKKILDVIIDYYEKTYLVPKYGKERAEKARRQISDLKAENKKAAFSQAAADRLD